jgi:hypothetical protein
MGNSPRLRSTIPAHRHLSQPPYTNLPSTTLISHSIKQTDNRDRVTERERERVEEYADTTHLFCFVFQNFKIVVSPTVSSLAVIDDSG